MRALFLVADNVEDLEFFYPYYRLREEGFDVDGNLITSRSPEDLPAFCREMLAAVRHLV